MGISYFQGLLEDVSPFIMPHAGLLFIFPFGGENTKAVFPLGALLLAVKKSGYRRLKYFVENLSWSDRKERSQLE